MLPSSINNGTRLAPYAALGIHALIILTNFKFKGFIFSHKEKGKWKHHFPC